MARRDPTHSARFSALGAALLAVVNSASAQIPEPSSTLYELRGGSTYQVGCFDPCLCPILEELPLQGTFKLRQIAEDMWFTTYAVTDVKWTVPLGNETICINGSGTYTIGGDFALTQQLELDLIVGDDPAQHFDSGMFPGGAEFPDIDIVISINGIYCFDTVIHIMAGPMGNTTPTTPRHAHFAVLPDRSLVEFSLFVGETQSPLIGSVRLFLGDPNVVVPAVVGLVGVSVDGADLVALDFEPDTVLPEPLRMFQDPAVYSTGAWNTLTGDIAFELHVTTPDGQLPVPQPLSLSGNLFDGYLSVAGDNGNVADGIMSVTLQALELPLPPAPMDVSFSTEIGFGAATIWPPAPNVIVPVSDGDLLSRRGHIARTNQQLTAQLGIMPIVPDLGLDAVLTGPRGQIWFSFEEVYQQIWSETLGIWLKHGDLLSEEGRVVQTNEQLLERFAMMPPAFDAGLDAVARAPNRAILFSVEQGFFSEALGVQVGPGDLLSNRGRIVRTNQRLLENFDPIDAGGTDYGLDAVLLRSRHEIWFSTEIGFTDTCFGWIGDGDLLSTLGYVVARNLDLVEAFGPVEDTDNFGLDGVNRLVPCRMGDFDFDGDLDLHDFADLQSAYSGSAAPSPLPELGDFDGDLDVDRLDVNIWMECHSGPGTPSAMACGE